MKKLLLFLIGISVVFVLQAQEKANTDRPKIGLVLSGGGAKGLQLTLAGFQYVNTFMFCPGI